MARPALEVAEIFRDHGAAWRLANAGHISLGQLKVMSAIERCRTISCPAVVCTANRERAHIHLIVPGGGIAMDASKWVPCRPSFSYAPARAFSDHTEPAPLPSNRSRRHDHRDHIRPMSRARRSLGNRRLCQHPMPIFEFARFSDVTTCLKRPHHRSHCFSYLPRRPKTEAHLHPDERFHFATKRSSKFGPR